MGRFPNKYVIGLTGNIATGKSVVRQMLQHLGAYTIDADGLAHQVMMPNAPAYKPIINTFGQFIVGADGRIDRAILGKMVFGNPEALRKLEEITHPFIRQALNALVSRAQQPFVVIEAIKLLEGETAQLVDAVWVTNASPQTQYKRLIEKRKMADADAKQRIQAQGAQADKLAKATVVIQNDGSVEDTWKQVQTKFAEAKRLFASQTASASGNASQAPVAPIEEAPEDKTFDVSGITVKRGMPNNAQAIADFVSTSTGKSVSRMDIMMSFGQKSFLVAQDSTGKMLAVMGWTVENLVTRVDEFYIAQDATVKAVAHACVLAVEDASKELQSEVGFFFIPPSSPPDTVKTLQANGYGTISLPEIKVPAWREAVEEATRENKQLLILWKQLRKDRVLTPI